MTDMTFENNFFTKNTRTFLIIPAVIIGLAIILSIFGVGLNAGIDFTGGSLLTYTVGEDFDVSVVEDALKSAGVNEYQIAKTGTTYTCSRSDDEGATWTVMFTYEANEDGAVNATKLVIDAYTGMTAGRSFILQKLVIE